MPRFIVRLLPLAASLAVVLTGCMLGPVDGMVMNPSSVTHFGGYTLKPNEPVQVEAFDGTYWIAIANTTSGAAPERQYDGQDLYRWSVDAAVPLTLWRGVAYKPGRVARVRARVGTSLQHEAVTFTSDWLVCLGRNPSIYDFINNCKSPRSPNAFLYTSDYPAGVDLKIKLMTREADGLGLWVSIQNIGRPGKIARLRCQVGSTDPGIWVDVNEAINPLGFKLIYVNHYTAVGTYMICTVYGVNEDGAAEADTSNNKLAEFLRHTSY